MNPCDRFFVLHALREANPQHLIGHPHDNIVVAVVPLVLEAGRFHKVPNGKAVIQKTAVRPREGSVGVVHRQRQQEVAGV